MKIVRIPTRVVLECKLCGCRISVNHEDWVDVIKGNAVQCCPCCKTNNFTKIGCTY